MYLTPTLEFSRDPLSDTSPTWVDITAYLLEAEWSFGVDDEAGEPQPGEATFVLDDRSRRFEPDYAAGAYYPDIVPMRRFRLRVQDGVGSGTVYDHGIWYAVSWQPGWPERSLNQETVVSCVDGSAVLAQDDLPQMDPPDASSYADVVGFDEPWGYWRLGEPEGTRARARIVVERATFGLGRRKFRRKVKRRRGTTYSTRAEAGSSSGPAGVYKNTPALGQPGAILGDADTSVLFAAASSEYVTLPFEDSESIGVGSGAKSSTTLEAWVKPTGAYGTDMGIIGGPATGGGDSIWAIYLSTSGKAVMFTPVNALDIATGSATLTLDAWAYVVGTWDGNIARIYVDGVLDGQSTGGFHTDIPAPVGTTFSIGRYFRSSTARYFNGWIDEPAVYEKVLSDARRDAHYTAATARGWPEQTAGTRIADIAAHALWSEANIQTAGRDVQPAMQVGQARLEEIGELAHAEGTTTMVFFDGGGDPVYLGDEWQATAVAYNTPQATFGTGTGEVPFDDVGLVYDDEIYNDVTANMEGGELVNVVNTTSVDEYGRRVNVEWTDVVLADQDDVESLANHVETFYSTPAFRPVTVDLNGDDSSARTQILSRGVGDMVRVKHRPAGGTAIDRVCNIVGATIRVGRGDSSERGQLTCTWNLGRGFNAGAGEWRAGVAGFSEAGVTTVAG